MFFKTIWGKIREAWPVNRVVTIMTPILFVPASGWLTTRFAEAGFELDPTQFTIVFAVGATAALGAAYKWMDGWQKYEAQIAHPELEPVLAPEHQTPPPDETQGGGLVGDPDEDFTLSQPDDIHEDDALPDEAELPDEESRPSDPTG